MSDVNMKLLLDIGVSLSLETNHDRLFQQILFSAIEISGCERGILYLKEGQILGAKVVINDLEKEMKEEDERWIDLPFISLKENAMSAVCAKTGELISIGDKAKHSEYDYKDIFQYDAIYGSDTKSVLVVPMKGRQGQVIGVLQLMSDVLLEHGFTKESKLFIGAVSVFSAISVENMNYISEVKNFFDSFVQVLSAAIDERTPYNTAHTWNMVRCGTKFLDYLNDVYEKEGGHRIISPSHKEEILMSIWLHDIGKLVTPRKIMDKPTRLGSGIEQVFCRLEEARLHIRICVLKGLYTEKEGKEFQQRLEYFKRNIEEINYATSLTDSMSQAIDEMEQATYQDESGVKHPLLPDDVFECLRIENGTLTDKEREIMRQHVCVTERLLSNIHFSQEYKHVPKWASSHHELMDGSGYPRQLIGNEIPYESRILTILDVFDALTADDRPYKQGVSIGETLQIIEQMAKSNKLDRELTKHFIKSQCWELPI